MTLNIAQNETPNKSETIHWSDNVPLHQMSTPAYVYSISEVRKSILDLRAAVGTDLILSFKACPNYEIISRMQECRLLGVELASLGELTNFSGCESYSLYVNTPALDADIIRTSIAYNATIIIDDIQQLRLIYKHWRKETPLKIGLRLSNRLISDFSANAKKLRMDQFGMDLNSIANTIVLARKLNINIVGIHLFAGSHTFTDISFHLIVAIKKIIPIVEEQLGYELQWVNLGGGLEENWVSNGYNFEAYRKTLEQIPMRLEKIHEFGRSIFASSGIFLTRVTAVKNISGQTYAVCDGGISQSFLLAQTESILKKRVTPNIFKSSTKNLESKQKTILVGPSCSRNDVIGETNSILKIGDLLIFKNCGAYYQTYSMDNFLTLKKAKTYVI